MIEHGAAPWGETVTWDQVWTGAVGCARRHAPHPDDVEDIAQEAVIRAWRRRETLRESDRFAAWLATIVRREAAREAARPRPLLGELARDVGDEDERLVRLVERADLELGLRRLEPDERLLLRLRYAEDLTQAAIAANLELPEGTVKVRLHRARRKLRRLLSEA